MPNGRKFQIALSHADLHRVGTAAKRTGVSLEIFARTAVLNAIHALAENEPHMLTAVHRHEATKGKMWTEEELRARGLPLYWSNAWVEHQVDQGYSVVQIALNAGGYQQMAVSRHMRHVYNIKGRYVLTPTQKTAILARLAEGATRRQIMEEFSVSEFTAAKYAQIVEADHESLLRFRQDAARLGWPATRHNVAQTLFEGDKLRADNWVTERIRRGWLRRVKAGLYVVAPEPLPSLRAVADHGNGNTLDGEAK